MRQSCVCRYCTDWWRVCVSGRCQWQLHTGDHRLCWTVSAPQQNLHCAALSPRPAWLGCRISSFLFGCYPIVVLLSVKGLCMSPMPLWGPTVWAFSPPCLCYCFARMMKHALELYLPIDQLLLCQTDVPSPVVDPYADRLMAGKHSNAYDQSPCTPSEV